MFAIIKTGGKQYKVAKNDVVTVERLAAEAGSTVALDSVLMLGGDEAAPRVGAPYLDNARVHAEVLEQTRGPKLLWFKKRRRKNSRRKGGHRQDLTVLRVRDITLDGESVIGEAAATKAPPTNAELKARTNQAVTQASQWRARTAKTRNSVGAA